MNKLSKQTKFIIAAACFLLAVFTFMFSTARMSTLNSQNMANIRYGMSFINKANNNSVDSFDMIEGKLVLNEMEEIADKITFYKWFRIIGTLVFLGGGIFFIVSANKKEDEVTDEDFSGQ